MNENLRQSKAIKVCERWMNRWKRKRVAGKTLFMIIIFIVTLTAVFLYLQRSTESAEEYVQRTLGDAVKIICSDDVSQNESIVFFDDEERYIWCILIKKTSIGYKTVRISGKINESNEGYICSYFQENGTEKWIDWGVATDKNIKYVLADSYKMNVIKVNKYSYYICWIIGEGESPPHDFSTGYR